MKRSLLQTAIIIGLAATAVPAVAGARGGAVARGFHVRMAPVRVAPPPRAAAPRIAMAPPLPGLGLRPVGGEPRGAAFGQRPLEGGVEHRSFDHRRFGERHWRRWRGLPIYSSTIGTGYPYSTDDDDASYAPGYSPPPEDYSEHYVHSAASLPLPQSQYNPGPRIIYVHEPQPNRHAKPLPTVIYGIQPRPPYNDVPSAPPLY